MPRETKQEETKQEETLSPEVRRGLEARGIDPDLSLRFLKLYRERLSGTEGDASSGGASPGARPVPRERVLPAPEESDRICDSRSPDFSFTLSHDEAVARTEALGLSSDSEISLWREQGCFRGRKLILSRKDLECFGRKLYPLYAFGVLNGGSATSYCDRKKNKAAAGRFFPILEEAFETMRRLSREKPKGVTPAYLNEDGTPGFSYMELKMRSLLREGLRGAGSAPISLFQMVSRATERSIREHYQNYRRSEALSGLWAGIPEGKIRELRECLFSPPTGVQPLISAYTHSEVRPADFFKDAEGCFLPLPGGHGQCFIAFRDLLRRFREEGKRFISIGNVDNNGYRPDPLSLALLALSGKQALFHFSFKTPVDTKGGVLVREVLGSSPEGSRGGEQQTSLGQLTCLDIGPGISEEEVRRHEAKGAPVLFNCAVGFFSLDVLLEKLDSVVTGLPIRFSDQNKDIGRYAQGEQITWEVMNLLDDFLILGVEKSRNFLAAKTLTENLLTSGIGREAYPAGSLKDSAELLFRGFRRVLAEDYGLEERAGRWQVPLSEKKD